jgi:hypothetical protein
MIEKRRFQLSFATSRSKAFDFERASLDMLAKHKHQGASAYGSPSPCKRLDLIPPMGKVILSQGVNHNG